MLLSLISGTLGPRHWVCYLRAHCCRNMLPSWLEALPQIFLFTLIPRIFWNKKHFFFLIILATCCGPTGFQDQVKWMAWLGAQVVSGIHRLHWMPGPSLLAHLMLWNSDIEALLAVGDAGAEGRGNKITKGQTLVSRGLRLALALMV